MHLVTTIAPVDPGVFEISMRLVFRGPPRDAVQLAEKLRELIKFGTQTEAREELESIAKNIERLFLEGKVPLDAVPIDPKPFPLSDYLDGLTRKGA